jgi:hypothetical protein
MVAKLPEPSKLGPSHDLWLAHGSWCMLEAHDAQSPRAAVARAPMVASLLMSNCRRKTGANRGETIYILGPTCHYTRSSKGRPGGGSSLARWSGRWQTTVSRKKPGEESKQGPSADFPSCTGTRWTWGNYFNSLPAMRSMDEGAQQWEAEVDDVIRTRGRRSGARATKPGAKAPLGPGGSLGMRNREIAGQNIG